MQFIEHIASPAEQNFFGVTDLTFIFRNVYTVSYIRVYSQIVNYNLQFTKLPGNKYQSAAN